MKKYHSQRPFLLESGKNLNSLKIAYHTFGKINEKQDNIIWVCHALSGNSNVIEWWDGLFGKDKTFDPKDYFIVCANTIGSPYGSSRPVNLEFPYFTVRDVVNAHCLLAEELGIQKIHTAIGASFGGNQVLEFSKIFQGEIKHLIVMACSSKESAWGIAVHESQRIALHSDATFGKQGEGIAGMKAARSMALLTYRTSDVFDRSQTDLEEKLDDFKAAAYLQYKGDKFVKRFDSLCYYYLMKCLDSHNLGRGRGGEKRALNSIDIPTLIVGFTSDILVPIRFQEFIAEHIPNAVFCKIESQYGHDGFLTESATIAEKITSFYKRQQNQNSSIKRKVLKFGGKSLGTKERLVNVLDIVEKEATHGPIALVVSAQGETTDRLIRLFNLAKEDLPFQDELNDLIAYQKSFVTDYNLQEDLGELKAVLSAIAKLKTADPIAYAKVVSFGELMSAKVIASLLRERGQQSQFVDSRGLLVEKENLSSREQLINLELSKSNTKACFVKFSEKMIPVVTGYIASNSKGQTVTLGRNGSNYSATLIASFIEAAEIQNWTDVDGLYSASPKLVSNAIRIDTISYREANELANFGLNLLHPKTILPLFQNDIPLRIKSTLAPDSPGTLVNKKGGAKGIKAVSVLEEVALVTMEGQGLSGKIGIDSRIFTVLSKNEISIRLISQASSERGIGFVVNRGDASRAEFLLTTEFQEELEQKTISSIRINLEVAVIAIVGRHNYALEAAIRGLRSNRIWMHLISNSMSGEHISLVVDNKHLKKAVRVVHNQVFGIIKTLHVFAIGKGNVGGTFINQVIQTPAELKETRNLEVKLIGVADSTRFILKPEGLNGNWKKELASSEEVTSFHSVLEQLQNSGLENIVIADNTSSESIALSYPQIIRHGFSIAASNKKANSMDYTFYKNLREKLKRKGQAFYYETNVGAGLPIIDTLKNLFHSAEKITAIKGVFSGSLSYLFNNYSLGSDSFSSVLMEAKEKGFTEPDPREDLLGLDVARKLIILAREIGFSAELDEVMVENLIPESMRSIESFDDFMKEKMNLDAYYNELRSRLDGKVLRYVGMLDVPSGKLSVSLQEVDADSPLGNIKNADSLFEIYTDTYGEQPMIIQGAGAGAAVTARGVYSDLLRIGMQL